MLRDTLVGLIEPMRAARELNPLALFTEQKRPSDDRPPCLENPRPEGTESTLTENAASPFHAEPKHGRLLEDCISKAGVRQEYCAWDNVVKCFPNDFGQSRNPSKEERWSCAPYLFRNIEKHDPKVIIPLGNIALFALTGLKGITKYRGQRFIRRIGSKDRVIVPSFHPASALRGQAGNKDFITQDILHAWRIANAHPSQPPSLFPPS